MDNKNMNISLLGMPDHALHDLISSFPEAAHLKDKKNKKYIHSNENSLKIYGFTDPAKVVGLTVHDLDQFMRPYWGHDFADKVNDLDEYVTKECSVITDKNRVFLDKFGLAHIQDMIKVPIANASNQVTAIFTMIFEETGKIDNFSLFNIYKKIYDKKREACFYFMNHLKINIFFRDSLSNKEMMCLLCMIENNTYKYIAKKMNLSIKTIESHVNHIANKVKSKNLEAIIEFLRIGSNAREI